MANILTSSIGKKLIMSISGLFLIIFLLLHMSINLFAVLDLVSGTYGAPDGLFQKGCDFMSLPIVTVMVPVLALGFVIHIFYGCYLTWTNLKARGGYCRYAVSSKAKTDSFASRNMIVLGIIILGFIAFHLTHGFWSAFQTFGWNNMIWLKRLKVIAYIFATLIFLGFATVAVAVCIHNYCPCLA